MLWICTVGDGPQSFQCCSLIVAPWGHDAMGAVFAWMLCVFLLKKEKLALEWGIWRAKFASSHLEFLSLGMVVFSFYSNTEALLLYFSDFQTDRVQRHSAYREYGVLCFIFNSPVYFWGTVVVIWQYAWYSCQPGVRLPTTDSASINSCWRL